MDTESSQTACGSTNIKSKAYKIKFDRGKWKMTEQYMYIDMYIYCSVMEPCHGNLENWKRLVQEGG